MTEAPRIVLADPDPYLAFLIRQEFPNARIDEAFRGGEIGELLSRPADLLVVDLDDADELASVASSTDVPVVGVLDGARIRHSLKHAQQSFLIRPFLPAEVHRTLRGALGLRQVAAKRSRRSFGARSILAASRIAAVALAGVLETSRGVSSRAPILAIMGLYVVARAILRDGRFGLGADIAVASAAIFATGGMTSPYAPLGLVVVVQFGFAYGIVAGTIGGFVVSLSGTMSIFSQVARGSIPPIQAAAWFAFFVLGGSVAGEANRLGHRPEAGLLSEANTVLSSLYRIARAMPGGLEPSIIAGSVINEIKDVVRSPAAAMLVRQVGTLTVPGSYGLVHPDLLARGHWDSDLGALARSGPVVISTDQLPAQAASAWNGYGCLIVAPIQQDSSTFGLLMCACPDHSKHARNLRFVGQLAEECAIAVENSELFARVREMSIDEERHRLARDLHDGVAQALTYLRLELDLISRRDGSLALQDDLERLSRVVQRAGIDVREMIFGLRSPVSAEGLTVSLRAYLRDLRRFGGPSIDFTASGIVRAEPETESEVFRITQEAVSNAVHHGHARTINVSLSVGVEELRLTVEDDGIGFDPRTPSGGVGLQAMSERARRLNGTLDVTRAEKGGMRVALVCPLSQEEVA